MRIFVLGNGRVASEALGWLRERNENLVGIAIHPPQRRRCGREILANAQLPSARVFDGARLGEAATHRAIEALRPDIALSVFFGYIVRQRFLRIFPAGMVNLHPAFLPYGRGAYPNVWSIVEETPAGATLHYVDEGVDTGDIISQASVPVALHDTGETLYRKLEDACIELFKETWPSIRSGNAQRLPQNASEGSHHRARDVEEIDEIHLDQTYTGGQLINLIRARTFPPHPGAYYVDGGQKVFLRLQLLREDASPDGSRP